LIRRATDNDIPRITGIFVWEEDGQVVGFSAADPRNGSISALFMDHAYEGRGIARALLE
jgi:GNAT superfamily N-acetyltransferase